MKHSTFNRWPAFLLHRASIALKVRAWLCLGLVLIGCVKSQAQIVLQIDVTNPAAVTFTATSANSGITYAGASNTSPQFSNSIGMGDGISLLGFFKNDVTANSYGGDGSGATVSSTLAMGTVPGIYFDNAVTWDDTTYAGNSSTARDLNFYRNDNNQILSFSTSSTALTGVMTYNFTTGTVDHTADLPTVGMSGNVIVPYGLGTIGTWVVVSAVPEPATYAAISGATALMGAVILRRRTRPSVSIRAIRGQQDRAV